MSPPPEPPEPSVVRRRPVWLLIVAMLAAAVLGFMVNELRDRVSFEKKRADKVTAALVQECEDARPHGYVCKTDLSKLGQPQRGAKGDKGDKGDQGIPGPRGRQGLGGPPPSEAQIQAAVRAYLEAHPPPAGQDGQDGQDGAPGPACPDGWHRAQVQVLLKNHWTTVLLCVRD